MLRRDGGDPAGRPQKGRRSGRTASACNLKSDKIAVENVYSQLRHIFNHYMEQGEQQKKQAYETLKAEFESRVQQAVQQQLGLPAGIKIDVEKQPQFQEEWRKVQTQLDSQYYKLLDEYKQELLAIP